MNAFIVDDEKLSREVLLRQLMAFDDIQVVGLATNARQAIKDIQDLNPDVIFLDISMPVMDGFSMLEQLPERPHVIFITSHTEYALDAIRADAVDYLLKPIKQQDIVRALDRLRKRMLTHDSSPVVGNLTERQHGQQAAYRKKFLLREGNRYHPITVEEIAYFFAEEKNVFIQLNDGRRFVWDESLDKLGEQLNPSLFYRVNRQLVIAHASIVSVQVWSKSKLKLQLKPKFHRDAIVSVEKASAFKAWLNH
jgi:DNA-binding LytR/AlgR family response regulator